MSDDKKRQFPRISLACDLEYKINIDAFDSFNDSGERDLEGEVSKTKDISLGGICMITYTPLPRNLNVDLSFKLHDSGKIIKVIGKVVWTEKFSIGDSNGYDNGIQFIDMADEDKLVLRRYLEKMSR